MSVTQTLTVATQVEAIEMVAVLRRKGLSAYFRLQVTGIFTVYSWEYEELPNSMTGGQSFNGWTVEELTHYAEG